VKRVLIVDDDPHIPEKLAVLFTGRYHFAVASNGFDALQHLGRETFDVILLDLRMPGLDGKGLVAELRAHRIQLPIILMSANPNLPAEARALGISQYLAKPFDIEALEQMIERA
jgi:DNA-binding NtrC family response regulator